MRPDDHLWEINSPKTWRTETLDYCPLGVSTNSVFLYIGVIVCVYYYYFVFLITEDEKFRECMKHEILWLNGHLRSFLFHFP